MKIKEIIKNNIQLYKQYFKYEPVYCIIRLFTSILGIIQPISSIYLFQIFLDAIFIEKSILKCILIAVILTILNVTVAIISWIVNNKLTPVSEQKNILRYTRELLHIYLDTDIEDIEDPIFYDKYTQVINDIAMRVMAVQDVICSLVGNICSLSVVVALMLRVGPFMILVSLIGVVLNLIMSPIMNKLSYDSYIEKTPFNRKQDYIKRVFYIRDYVKELKIYNVSNTFLNKIEKNSKTLINITKKYGNKYIIYGTVVSLIQCLSFALILCYLAYSALFKGWTMGYVASMYNASQELKNVIGQLFATLPLFDENSRYISNYNSLITIQSKIEKQSDRLKKKESDKFDFIKFKNVGFSYKNTKKDVLKNIDLKLVKGGKYALVGHNGAGKSTFISLLLRLYNPTNGTIFLNDIEYEKYDINELRRLFNVVFQDCQVYAMSIAENILLREIAEKEDEEIVWMALEKVELKEYVKGLPNGINSIITKEFSEDGVIFSGGQLQKILLARIFANDAPIIVLDEVTSAMDAISEYKMYNEIEKFAIDKTLIYISHKLSTTKNADCIVVFDKGCIVEQGTHTELMQEEGIYAKMFSIQAEKYGI